MTLMKGSLRFPILHLEEENNSMAYGTLAKAIHNDIISFCFPQDDNYLTQASQYQSLVCLPKPEDDSIIRNPTMLSSCA